MHQREVISRVAAAALRWSDPGAPERTAAVEDLLSLDNTFTREATTFALDQVMSELTANNLERWLDARSSRSATAVCVLSPGNLPTVEFQDCIAVLLAGHRYVGVLSSANNALLPAFLQSAGLMGQAEFRALEDGLAGARAVVATGADETVELVERKARDAGIAPDALLLRGTSSSVAIVTGEESADDLLGLAEDCLLHEGRGCRNVSIIWGPKGGEPDAFLEAAAMFRGVFPAHTSTQAALRIPAAMLHALDVPHAAADDLSFLVSVGEPEVREPCHIRWVEYGHIDEACDWVASHADSLQLVVAPFAGFAARRLKGVPRVDAGQTQRPPIDWKPDRVDVLDFLCGF